MEWCENMLVGHHPPTSGETMQYPFTTTTGTCGNTVISGCSNQAPYVYQSHPEKTYIQLHHQLLQFFPSAVPVNSCMRIGYMK